MVRNDEILSSLGLWYLEFTLIRVIYFTLPSIGSMSLVVGSLCTGPAAPDLPCFVRAQSCFSIRFGYKRKAVAPF